MTVIQLEIPDELAERLAPYQGQLSELLELDLKEHLQRERNQIMQILTLLIKSECLHSGLPVSPIAGKHLFPLQVNRSAR